VALLPAGLIIAARYPGGSVETASKLIQSTVAEGFYLAIVSIATAFVCGGLIFLLAGVRKGISVSDYLGLKSPRSTAIFKWLGVAVALWALCDTSSVLLKRNVVPDFMVKAYLTAGSVPLFWLGIAVAAPVFEELFFRGFIFAGWARSRLRPTGTIFLTAALWAAIHQQYDFYDMTMIGVMGILLGFTRRFSCTACKILLPRPSCGCSRATASECRPIVQFLPVSFRPCVRTPNERGALGIKKR